MNRKFKEAEVVENPTFGMTTESGKVQPIIQEESEDGD